MTAADVPPFLLRYAAPAVRGSLSRPAWLMVSPFLPRLVKVLVEVAVAVTAPWLLPFLPLVEEFLDWVSDRKVTPSQREQLRQVIALYRAYEAQHISEPVRYAVANPENPG